MLHILDSYWLIMLLFPRPFFLQEEEEDEGEGVIRLTERANSFPFWVSSAHKFCAAPKSPLFFDLKPLPYDVS